MKNNIKDITIIGGGIMGLFTAYYASAFVKNIVILEKRAIGNKEASSFNYTRSIRTDYLDPFYARLAYEAQFLWQDLQKKSNRQFFKNCGCLNLVKKAITPDISRTYAEISYQNIKNLNFDPIKFSRKQLQKRFPQFDVDFGCLDTKGGFLYIPPITSLLLALLKKQNVRIIENIDITKIEQKKDYVTIATTQGELTSKQIVITTGIWVNDVLKCITNNTLTFPIKAYKPKERKYYYPTSGKKSLFLPENFPVFAYLDIGIYGHPVSDKKGAVKISYYNPPDLGLEANAEITSIAEFVKKCMPGLQNARYEEITNADLCSYDLVEDDNFILGKLPGLDRISVGAGWRGTGYKFSPLIGKILMQLALQQDTVYNISQFNPKRFVT